MTTRQTIASPTPANIKISSPIPKKISRIFGHIFPKISRIPKKNLSHFRTHFPKNLSHPVQNRLFPPNLLKAIQVKPVKQVKQVKQMKQTASREPRATARDRPYYTTNRLAKPRSEERRVGKECRSRLTAEK